MAAKDTVDEDVRINFTRQLYKLRDDSVTEVKFPSTLSNIERKFLHKLSEELGLKSKSSGVGEARCITVTKPKQASVIGADVDNEVVDCIPSFTLSKKALDALTKRFGTRQISSSSSSSSSSTSTVTATSFSSSKASSLQEDGNKLEAAHKKAQSHRCAHPIYLKMQEARSNLPAFHHKSAVCTLLLENQIVLVSGETGCGKTTQVPQFLLDHPDIGPRCRIAVTQPRRLSAMSVSERIAKERGEQIGGTIGYNIRLESEMNRTTQVLFVTPGVLLRKLQNDPLLEEFSHIIIDEAHERDRHTEFLLIILRDICSRRKDLKLILMSATMHTNKLSSYFGNVPHIHMGGSVFPVQEFFLEHVLRFTDYLKSSGVMKTGLIANDAVSAYAQTSQSYFCSMCATGPFKSPEELGTHVALCSPTSKNSNGGVLGNVSRNAMVSARGYSNLDDLVRVLTSAATAGQESKAAAAAAAAAAIARNISREAAKKGKPSSSTATTSVATSTVTNTTAANIKSKTPTKNNATKDTEDDAPDGDDHDDDDDDDEGDDSNSEDGSEDDMDTPAVDSIAAENKITVTDDLSGEALLRQYHLNWDDTQVDYDLIISLLRYIFNSEFGKEGSVLIFLPGWDDISKLFRMLSATSDFGNSAIFKLIQLHSGIPKREQNAVFEPLLPGEHKIILSTNIAETSITIDDVAVVIDSGRGKEKIYDPHVKLDYLKSTWISQASARQRKGRAGRTRSGVCFHLMSKRRHKSLPEFQDSELLRMPLEELVLQTKQLGLAPGAGDSADSVQAFLLKALDPPHVLSIVNAVQLLQNINCLDENECVTNIGSAVSKLPCDPRLGRVIILGCLFGCGPAILSTATVMGYRDPFIMPTSDAHRALCNKIKAELAQGLPSDQISLLKAMEGFNTNLSRFNLGKAYQYCDEHFLSRSTMNYLTELLQQLGETVKDVGLNISRSFSQRNNGNMPLLMSLIGIGLLPNVGIRHNGSTIFKTEKGRKARIHPSSINSRSQLYKNICKEEIEVMGYLDLVSSTNNNHHDNVGGANLSMLNCTPVSPFALILTCGNIKQTAINNSEEDKDGSDKDIVLIEIDGWLRFKAGKDLVRLILCARSVFMEAVSAYITNPDQFVGTSLAVDIDAITQALAAEQPQSSIIISNGNGNGNNNNNIGGGGGGRGGRGNSGGGGGGGGGGRGGGRGFSR